MNEKNITNALQKITDHKSFKYSKRSIGFLNYICHLTMEGKQDHIKEYSIGVDAFELDTTFDPQLDPRVRVEARRLRKKLEDYYKQSGKDDPVRIFIPKGSYIPEFHIIEKEKTIPSIEFIFCIKGKTIRIEMPFIEVKKKYDLEHFVRNTILNKLFILSEIKTPKMDDSTITIKTQMRQIGSSSMELTLFNKHKKYKIQINVHSEKKIKRINASIDEILSYFLGSSDEKSDKEKKNVSR